VVREPNLAAAAFGKEDKRQCPHGNRLHEEKFLHRIGLSTATKRTPAKTAKTASETTHGGPMKASQNGLRMLDGRSIAAARESMKAVPSCPASFKEGDCGAIAVGFRWSQAYKWQAERSNTARRPTLPQGVDRLFAFR